MGNNWKYPLSPAQITGRQILTGDRPITKIHSAVQELQEKTIIRATCTVNGQSATCTVVDNQLNIIIDMNDLDLDIPDGNAVNEGLWWNGSAWVPGPMRAI